MTMLVLDHFVTNDLIRERQASGLDRYDEVWDGVYVVMPLPNIEHQEIGTKLSTVFTLSIDWAGLGKTFHGVNVSDRDADWRSNYRCPDVAVYLNDNPARACGAQWNGGPDFAVEITSPGDRSRDKLGFYAGVGVRDLLVLDRDPWVLELYRERDGVLAPVGRSSPETGEVLASEVLPLRFRLAPGEGRPRIEIAHTDGRQTWSV